MGMAWTFSPVRLSSVVQGANKDDSDAAFGHRCLAPPPLLSITDRRPEECSFHTCFFFISLDRFRFLGVCRNGHALARRR